MERNEGVLTEDEISSCLSELGNSATGLDVYRCLSMPGRHLKTISALCTYIHLQRLELPHNNIKDLSCVSHMPYLITLDASHNQITDFFGFQPPKNLKEVDLSHNQMAIMTDLSACCSLCQLRLDYNCFSEICGLEHCASLRHLSLAHNKISRITGLDNLPLKNLCLRGNLIEKIENMETLRTLRVLDLSRNRIGSLLGLRELRALASINLEGNLISEIKEVAHIHELLLLQDLNQLSNPVKEQPDYRLAVIFLLQHLTVLDQEKVTAEEKVSAVNKFDPPLDVVAARDHMTHMMYQLIQPQVIYDSTLPSLDTPYPMLVLTGPQACGKRELAHKLCQDFSNFFAYAACHTTRGPYFGEEDGSDYHFVTEEDFQNMIHMGGFIQTVQYAGHWYGLSRAAVEEVARQGLACCLHMELEGVFGLKNSYFEPRYILLIPTEMEWYAGRLMARALYTHPQIQQAVARVDMYAHINSERPGFFDDVIPCDNLVEAYRKLRQVLTQYLGLEELEGGLRRTVPTPDDTSTVLTRDSLLAEDSQAPPPGPETGRVTLSAPDVDPSDQNQLLAQLGPQNTSAELASIHRRQQRVREALAGKSSGAYAGLFKSRCPQTGSSSLAPQMLQDPAFLSPMMPSHAPKPHQSENSSSEDSRAGSGLSIPSSAGAFTEAAGPAWASDVRRSALEDNLDTLEDAVELGHAPISPRPGSERLSPAASTRPGSNVKPVLPPIPSGRKTPLPRTPRLENEQVD